MNVSEIFHPSKAAFQYDREGSFQWAWCGRVDYRQALEWQKALLQARLDKQVPDTLLFLEHPHVYTLGRSAQHSDILLSAAECAQRQIAVEKTDRGGKVTYHGPGQLVGYLIFDLRARSWSVPQFVSWVEQSLRHYAQCQGLDAVRRDNCPGLWVQDKKLASLGFHIHRGVSYHGFALNVDPDLKLFKGIIPCGVFQEMTSFQEQGCAPKSLAYTASLIVESFASHSSACGL